MPRKARELSAVEVRRLTPPGTGGNKSHAVGGVDGLMLQVTPTGARSWILRYQVGGKFGQFMLIGETAAFSILAL